MKSGKRIRELEDRVRELETQVMLGEIRYRVLVRAIQKVARKVGV